MVDRTVQLGEWDDPVPTLPEVAYEPAGVVAASPATTTRSTSPSSSSAPRSRPAAPRCSCPRPGRRSRRFWMGELFEEAGLSPLVSLNVVIGACRSWVSSSPPTGVSTGSRSPARTPSAPGSWSRRRADSRASPSNSAASPRASCSAGRRRADLARRHPPPLGPQRRPGLRGARPDAVHESLMRRVPGGASADAFGALMVGDPWDPAANVGPMIRAGPPGAGSAASSTRRWPTAARSCCPSSHQAGAGAGLLRQPGRLRRAPRTTTEPCSRRVFGPVGVILPFSHRGERSGSPTTRPTVWPRTSTARIPTGHALAAQTARRHGVGQRGGNMRPDAPFGGFGLSGVGREIGEWGIREYLEVQHVQWRP